MTTHRRLKQTGVAWQNVDGQIVCLDLSTSRYLAINSTGAVLWPLLVDGADVPDLVACLADRFGLDEASAQRDVTAFLTSLDAQQLLDPVS